MRIALVCERFDPNGGGLEQWACQFVRILIRRGHEVHVMAFRAAEQMDAAAPFVHILPWHRSRLERARAVEAALPGIAADVVHDLGVGWACDLLHPQAGSRLANRQHELRGRTLRERCLQGLTPKYWRWLHEVRELERRQYQSSCAVIAVSNMVAGHLCELHGVSANRIHVIPNGVDTKRFSPQRQAAIRAAARRRLGLADETVFLFAAHNPGLKGLSPLLRAMADLKSPCPGARLVVIGSEPRIEHHRAAAKLGIQHSVIFAGFVDDTLPYFAAADVFVLPTYYDACSLSVLEAAACGLPVITTRHNGAVELMTHELEGFILDEPDEHHALAAAMARLTCCELRNRMGPAARELAVRCSLDANIAKIEEAYQQLCPR